MIQHINTKHNRYPSSLTQKTTIQYISTGRKRDTLNVCLVRRKTLHFPPQRTVQSGHLTAYDPSLPTMVDIKGYSYGELRRTRRRLRRRTVEWHRAGSSALLLHPLLRRFLRVRRDLRRMQALAEDIASSSFNVNIFSVNEALALFRAKPADLCRASDLLGVRSGSVRQRHRETSVEFLCAVLRRTSSPCSWRDVAHVYGRSSGALSEIFYETR